MQLFWPIAAAPAAAVKRRPRERPLAQPQISRSSQNTAQLTKNGPVAGAADDHRNEFQEHGEQHHCDNHWAYQPDLDTREDGRGSAGGRWGHAYVCVHV